MGSQVHIYGLLDFSYGDIGPLSISISVGTVGIPTFIPPKDYQFHKKKQISGTLKPSENTFETFDQKFYDREVGIPCCVPVTIQVFFSRSTTG